VVCVERVETEDEKRESTIEEMEPKAERDARGGGERCLGLTPETRCYVSRVHRTGEAGPSPGKWVPALALLVAVIPFLPTSIFVTHL
jgi:hypothetical protein